MKLLKIGVYVINMDLVTDMVVDEASVNVFLAVQRYTRNPPPAMPEAHTDTRELQFRGQEAAVLCRWIEQNLEQDLTPEIENI